MSVQNEIVTFEAKIQLDESSAARLTDGLKDATASCQSLSSAINATSKAMDKLRAEGKENTEEFKKLGEQLNQTKDKLKASQHRRTGHGKQSSSTASGRSGTAGRPEPGTPDAQGFGILA